MLLDGLCQLEPDGFDMQNQPERRRLDKQGKRLLLVPVGGVPLARLGLEDRLPRHVVKDAVLGGIKLFDDGELGTPFVPPFLECQAARRAWCEPRSRG